MLSVGKNIKKRNDKLQKIDIEKIYNALVNPKKQIKEFIEHLRILKSIDPKAYRSKKTDLPYVVAAIFNPEFRKTDNFSKIEHIILDLDHISDYDFDIDNLKNSLKKDNSVELIFVSPSGNGMKIFFRLKKPCFDHSKFSIFYQSFSKHFAQKHNIKQIVDYTTSDVTRACFISTDKNTYFNKNPDEIDINKFVDFNNVFQVQNLQKDIKIEKKQKLKNETDKGIDKDTFIEIKKKLNPKFAEKEEKIRQKHIFVPKKLDKIIEDVIDFLSDFELVVKEIRNIHYGKKFIFSHKQHTAEINVFYGKRGFSVVRSPKTGTNLELMELGFKVFTEFFARYSNLKGEKI